MNILARDVSKYLIEIDNLHYKRGDQQIFNGLDLQIPRGKVTAILGPSGSGKTTLLNLITGQLNSDQGAVLFEGRVVCPCSRSRLYKVRRRMGVLFQQGALLTGLSVFENVAFPLREHTDLPEQLNSASRPYETARCWTANCVESYAVTIVGWNGTPGRAGTGAGYGSPVDDL